MIIDTHSHIYDEVFADDIDSIIDRAKEAKVETVLLPNVDLDTIDLVNKMAQAYPDYCFPMMGLHPTSVTADWEKDLALIKEQFKHNKYIAVGEIGIDLYWDQSLASEQKAAFEEQLKWCIEFDLPVSIHSRSAVIECIESIRKIGADNLYGSFHSFGGSADELKEVLTLKNFLVGVNGTVTYKNSTLPDALALTDLSRLIIETDAPYLPPVPYRGKRNEPSYTAYIVDKLSDIYEISYEEVERVTTENAKRLFRLNEYK